MFLFKVHILVRKELFVSAPEVTEPFRESIALYREIREEQENLSCRSLEPRKWGS
jgi:hypothetical protein